MSDKERKEQWQQSKDLESAGYDIQGKRRVRLHRGNETLKHRMAKMCVTHVLWENDFLVDSEVELSTGDRADILAYGHTDRKPIVVELESNCNRTVRLENSKKYTRGIVRDTLTVDVAELPTEIEAMEEQVESELFGR